MKTLKDLVIGDKALVVDIGGDINIRKKLYEFGLTPGVIVEFINTAPFGDPINIKLRGFNLAIRREIAEHIHIKEEG